MASDSSAKAGSKVLRGNGASPETLLRAESRNEERDDGRSGVVGLDVRVLDVDRARLVLESRFELGMVLGNWAAASKDFPRVQCRLSLSGIGVPGCDAMRIVSRLLRQSSSRVGHNVWKRDSAPRQTFGTRALASRRGSEGQAASHYANNVPRCAATQRGSLASRARQHSDVFHARFVDIMSARKRNEMEYGKVCGNKILFW